MILRTLIIFSGFPRVVRAVDCAVAREEQRDSFPKSASTPRKECFALCSVTATSSFDGTYSSWTLANGMRIRSIPLVLLFLSLLCSRISAFQSCRIQAVSRFDTTPIAIKNRQTTTTTNTRLQMGLLEEIQQFSPAKAIKPWMWINAFVFGWSVLLLIELVTTLSPGDRLEGTQAYLVYNFGATIIWVVESSLNGVDFACENKEQRAPSVDASWFDRNSAWLFLVIEWGLAIYFLYDSTKVFQQWKIPDNDVGADFIDISINTGSYLYQILKLSSLEDPSPPSSSPRNDYTEVDVN